MSWCDPCAADPLTNDELRRLGVFWVSEAPDRPIPLGQVRPTIAPPAPQVFVTRLHVRYDAQHFPEDLVFQETADRANFQGRYVLRHAWRGEDDSCEAARHYKRDLVQRREREAQTLASLTGWNVDDVRRKMSLPAAADDGAPAEKWWRRIWR